MVVEEEYEIIPTSPIRRLDKRMSRMEVANSSSEIRRLIEQVIELIKSNQRIIDDIIKSDAELRNEISRLPGKMDELMANMGEFMDLLKSAASAEGPERQASDLEPLLKKITELVDQNKKTQDIGQATLTSLETIDKRLKRMSIQQQGAARRRV